MVLIARLSIVRWSLYAHLRFSSRMRSPQVVIRVATASGRVSAAADDAYCDSHPGRPSVWRRIVVVVRTAHLA